MVMGSKLHGYWGGGLGRRAIKRGEISKVGTAKLCRVYPDSEKIGSNCGGLRCDAEMNIDMKE